MHAARLRCGSQNGLDAKDSREAIVVSDLKRDVHWVHEVRSLLIGIRFSRSLTPTVLVGVGGVGS